MKASELKGKLFERETAAWWPHPSWVKPVTALDNDKQHGSAR